VGGIVPGEALDGLQLLGVEAHLSDLLDEAPQGADAQEIVFVLRLWI
jgi:hypothetical protein